MPEVPMSELARQYRDERDVARARIAELEQAALHAASDLQLAVALIASSGAIGDAETLVRRACNGLVVAFRGAHVAAGTGGERWTQEQVDEIRQSGRQRAAEYERYTD